MFIICTVYAERCFGGEKISLFLVKNCSLLHLLKKVYISKSMTEVKTASKWLKMEDTKLRKILMLTVNFCF